MKIKTRPPMTKEQVQVGRVYEIDYVDYSYPCSCECHTKKGIMHIDACCYDNSYNGPATCVLIENDKFYFLITPNKFVIVLLNQIRRELLDEKPIEITQRIQCYLTLYREKMFSYDN